MKKEILCILCSLFCFGYCFLIYSIKSGTRFYLIWGMGGVCFLGLTAFLHFDLWSRMPDVLQKITIIMLTLGILLFVVT